LKNISTSFFAENIRNFEEWNFSQETVEGESTRMNQE